MNDVRIAFTDNELCLGGGGFSCKVCHFGSQCQSGSNSFATPTHPFVTFRGEVGIL